MNKLVFLIIIIAATACSWSTDTRPSVETLPSATLAAAISAPATETETPAFQPTCVSDEKLTATVVATHEPQPTLLAPMSTSQNRVYLSVAELSHEHYVEHVAWPPTGRSLIYAIQGVWSENLVPFFEPEHWDWWQFNLEARRKTRLPSPMSQIGSETRRKLDVCLDTSLQLADNCTQSMPLWESSYSDFMVFKRVGQGETTWIAHKDGSGVTQLKGIESPQHVEWSPDGRWLVVSAYAYRAPGMEWHYLVDTEDYTTMLLDSLTEYELAYVNYIRPQFSPNGRYLAYAATDNPDYTLYSSYGLFLLDMSTLQSHRLTERFGPLQWNGNSQGLYVLDNAVDFEFAEDRLAQRVAVLYYIEFSGEIISETRLFDNINFYPSESPSAWHWAYSPEAQAISLVGLQPRNELGILLLMP